MPHLELAPPKPQKAWGWPAVVNLTLGGAGAGVFLLGFCFSVAIQLWPVQSQRFPFQMLASAMVGLGFFTIALEAGRPWRAYRLFSNLSGSWMSIESFAGVVFIAMAVISWRLPFSILVAIAVLAAIVLLISQAMMVYRATGVKAWNNTLIPLLFVSSGLMTACGFSLLNLKGHLGPAKLPLGAFSIIIFLNLAFWLRYLFGGDDHDFRQSVKGLRGPLWLTVIVGIGHVFPLSYFFSLFLIPGAEYPAAISTIFGFITGLALIGCGVLQKAGIIMAAGHFRSVVLGASPLDHTW